VNERILANCYTSGIFDLRYFQVLHINGVSNCNPKEVTLDRKGLWYQFLSEAHDRDAPVGRHGEKQHATGN
jgi:hypothetical protein